MAKDNFDLDKKDHEEFLQELEDDADYRASINLYQDKGKDTDTISVSVEGAAPTVPLHELLSEVTLKSKPVAVITDDDILIATTKGQGLLQIIEAKKK
eukprot:UN00054